MFYDYLKTDLVGVLTLVADEKGLRHINFQTSRFPVFLKQEWKHEPSFFTEIKTQLTNYFNGKIDAFDLPLAPVGTDFQKRVWQILQKIPYGTVTSYLWVAEQIDNPKAVRAVGGANGKNPLPVVIPCHRVIGSDGSLTGFGAGLKIKKCLIDLEKVSTTHPQFQKSSSGISGSTDIDKKKETLHANSHGMGFKVVAQPDSINVI
jgi:methylated-DNA-[protein]-cysteine S-methyltransferase